MTENDSPIAVSCFNETDPIREIILGYTENFHEDPSTIEIVNKTQAKYFGTVEEPSVEKLTTEFLHFKHILESMNVKVHVARPCPKEAHVPDELTPRDIGFVIGNNFFISHMAKKSREYEYLGIEHVIDRIPKENLFQVSSEAVVEGGDIVVDKGCVFVGLSQRTNLSGLKFLQTTLSNTPFKIIPVPLVSPEDGEDCLHLDCVFVPVGSKHALIYPEGIAKIPEEMRQLYTWITVTQEEQLALATNVLSIDSEIVISRNSSDRMYQKLCNIGLQVVLMNFDEAPKTGGSFRCCTLPLRREVKI